MSEKRETKILGIFIGLLIIQSLWTIAIEEIGYLIGLTINIFILVIWLRLELDSAKSRTTEEIIKKN